MTKQSDSPRTVGFNPGEKAKTSEKASSKSGEGSSATTTPKTTATPQTQQTAPSPNSEENSGETKRTRGLGTLIVERLATVTVTETEGLQGQTRSRSVWERVSTKGANEPIPFATVNDAKAWLKTEVEERRLACGSYRIIREVEVFSAKTEQRVFFDDGSTSA